MAALSRDQRETLARQLSAWIDRMVCDEANEVEFSVSSGLRVVVADDLEHTYGEPNGSATLVVHINGGARHSHEFSDGGPAAG